MRAAAGLRGQPLASMILSVRHGSAAWRIIALSIAALLAIAACAGPTAERSPGTSPADALPSPSVGPPSTAGDEPLAETPAGPDERDPDDPDDPDESGEDSAGSEPPDGEGTGTSRPGGSYDGGGPTDPDDTPTDDHPAVETDDPDGDGTGPGSTASATIVIAGDIAGCDWRSDSATAELLDDIPGIVMTAGDNAYPGGSDAQFRDCYHPTWGRFRDRTRPTPGNHDWSTPGAEGYFGYFGWRAGPAGRGYYRFDAGAWRIYALAGDCGAVGGCRASSPQGRWLAADLAADRRRCVLAVWHQPRFSSGPHGIRKPTKPLLRLLYESGAEIVINGHDHNYERFAPATPDGVADPSHGIRQFIVGTGGAPLYGFQRPFAPNSRVRNATTHGVLKVTLDDDRYAWEFVPVQGQTFTDAGSGRCHGRPPG